jgi:hypothetical protein
MAKVCCCIVVQRLESCSGSKPLRLKLEALVRHRGAAAWSGSGAPSLLLSSMRFKVQTNESGCIWWCRFTILLGWGRWLQVYSNTAEGLLVEGLDKVSYMMASVTLANDGLGRCKYRVEELWRSRLAATLAK